MPRKTRIRKERTKAFKCTNGCPDPIYEGDQLYEALDQKTLEAMKQATPNAMEFFICYRLLQSATRRAVAEHTGMDDKSLKEWEAGNILPSLDSLKKLKEYFGANINDAERFAELLVANRLSVAECSWGQGRHISFGSQLKALPDEELYNQLHAFYDDKPSIIRTRGNYIYALWRSMGMTPQVLVTEEQGNPASFKAGKSYHNLGHYNPDAMRAPNEGKITVHIKALEEKFALWEKENKPESEWLHPFMAGYQWWRTLPILAEGHVANLNRGGASARER